MNRITLTDSYIRTIQKPPKVIEVYDDYVSGLAIRVFPSGTKSFVIRYRFGDNSKRYTIGNFPDITLSKARKIVGEYKTLIRQGLDPMELAKRRQDESKLLTLNDVIDRYCEDELTRKKPSTQQSYRSRIKNHIRPKFGSSAIDQIRRIDLNDYLKNLKYKELQPVNAQRVQATMSAIFEYAIEIGALETNPVSGIKLISPSEFERERFFSIDEIKQLWEAFEKEQEPYQSLFKILLLTGKRIGESSMARWEHLDMEKKLWFLPKENTKSKRDHVIPISNLAFEIFCNLKIHTGSSNFVFNSRVKKDTHANHFQKPKLRVRSASGIDDFIPHDLRRTFSTHMGALGVPESIISRLLNHSVDYGSTMSTMTSKTTRIYNRYDYIKEQRHAVNVWSDYLLDNVIDG